MEPNSHIDTTYHHTQEIGRHSMGIVATPYSQDLVSIAKLTGTGYPVRMSPGAWMLAATVPPSAHTHVKSELPSTIAYKDEANVFTQNQSIQINGGRADFHSFLNGYVSLHMNLGNQPPTSTNYTLIADGSATGLNASASVDMRINGAQRLVVNNTATNVTGNLTASGTVTASGTNGTVVGRFQNTAGSLGVEMVLGSSQGAAINFFQNSFQNAIRVAGSDQMRFGGDRVVMQVPLHVNSQPIIGIDNGSTAQGAVLIRGGNVGTTNANGGDVFLHGGTGNGTGAAGDVVLAHTGSAARGRVLIGTATDDGSNLLQVAGNITASGHLSVSGGSASPMLQTANASSWSNDITQGAVLITARSPHGQRIQLDPRGSDGAGLISGATRFIGSVSFKFRNSFNNGFENIECAGITASGFILVNGAAAAGSASRLNGTTDFLNGTAIVTRISGAFGLHVGNTPINFGSSPVAFPDAQIIRSSAEVVDINNGTAGQFADLRLRNLTASGFVRQGATSLSANPTTLDLPSGAGQLYKNTTSGEVRMWFNDGGSMKSVLLS